MRFHSSSKPRRGGVVVVGCLPQIHSVFGGFHLVDVPDAKVTELVTAFRDKWNIERMAAGHCTGQFALELIECSGNVLTSLVSGWSFRYRHDLALWKLRSIGLTIPTTLILRADDMIA